MSRIFKASIVLALIAACLHRPPKLGEDGYQCVVSKVVDGDTIHCVDGDATHKIRLIGVFAPEMNKPGGVEARQYMLEICPVGSTITLEFDRYLRDRYGRVLAYVYNGDVFVNLEMVKSPHAVTSDKFPFKKSEEF